MTIDERIELTQGVKNDNGYGSIPKEALRAPLMTKTGNSTFYYYPYSQEEKRAEQVRQRRIVLGTIAVWLVFTAVGFWPIIQAL